MGVSEKGNCTCTGRYIILMHRSFYRRKLFIQMYTYAYNNCSKVLIFTYKHACGVSIHIYDPVEVSKLQSPEKYRTVSYLYIKTILITTILSNWYRQVYEKI